MYSYEPLHRTLRDLGATLNDMRHAGILNSRTIAKIYRDEPVSLKTIADICRHLDCPIEQVVEILRNYAK